MYGRDMMTNPRANRIATVREQLRHVHAAITNPALKSMGFNHRADELLGPTYGIGLHHDQAGRTWTKVGAQSTLKDLVSNLGIPVIAAAIPSVIETDALKHPVAIIGSRGLSAAGLAAPNSAR